MRGQLEQGAVSSPDTRGSATRASTGERAIFWAGAACAAAVLVLARMLIPDPAGVGTHTQLGLPPCGFLWLTSLPCPACGLTTSFAHIARLEITSAVHAHPLGVPLFLLTTLALPVCLRGATAGWSLHDALERFQVQRVALALAAGALLAWVARIGAIVLD